MSHLNAEHDITWYYECETFNATEEQGYIQALGCRFLCPLWLLLFKDVPASFLRLQRLPRMRLLPHFIYTSQSGSGPVGSGFCPCKTGFMVRNNHFSPSQMTMCNRRFCTFKSITEITVLTKRIRIMILALIKEPQALIVLCVCETQWLHHQTMGLMFLWPHRLSPREMYMHVLQVADAKE